LSAITKKESTVSTAFDDDAHTSGKGENLTMNDVAAPKFGQKTKITGKFQGP